MKRSDIAYHQPVSSNITKDDFTEGWKVMKEKPTSASKTGLHFGHLKASALHPQLADFESSISHLPFYTGYAPSPCKEGTIVMIKSVLGSTTSNPYGP